METMVFTISYFGCSFSSQIVASAAGCPCTLKPLKQVYNPTKTAPISESWSGLVVIFSTWLNQLWQSTLPLCLDAKEGIERPQGGCSEPAFKH